MEPVKIVLCDLDGTLSSSAWRDHLVEGDKKYYAEYYKGIPFDNIIPKVKSMLEDYEQQGCLIVYLTARPEWEEETRKTDDGKKEKTTLHVRKWTEDWLSKHGAPGWGSGAKLLMRKAKDSRPSSTVKEEILFKTLGGNKSKNIVLALDDNDHVIAMYKKHGIENAVLVTDPDIAPGIRTQHDNFMSNLPTAQVLVQAARILERSVRR